MNKSKYLCNLNDIPDPGSKGLNIEIDGVTREIFIVRRDGQVYGYVNSCPHTGASLEWQPDQFLTEDETLIICGMHGALFQIEDGLCVSGPCFGHSLESVKLIIHEGQVKLIS